MDAAGGIVRWGGGCADTVAVPGATGACPAGGIDRCCCAAIEDMVLWLAMEVVRLGGAW